MMNRSFGYANNNRNNYGWRGSSSVQDQGSDKKILDLIEKIRNCKPYLQKRLKIIEDSGQTKLLREEVQDITYWLEIAQEVRADLIYGVETLEVVHEKMMDMIRLHPIQGTLSSSRLEHFSDEDDDSAPRSPSPVGSSSDFASTKIIPLESSQSRLEWERSKADYNGLLSSERRPPDRSFDHLRNEPGKYNSNNEWPSSSGFEYTRRGDTDMRVDPPGRFDAFSNGRTMPPQRMREPHPPPRPFDDPRSSASNSPWVNSNESSPWNNFRNSGPRSLVHNRERVDDSVRDCDYRDRGRDPSPDRTRYYHPHQDRRQEDDRGRQFFRDQDFRDLSRSNSRDDNRQRDRSHDGSRDVPHEREWSRPSHHDSSRSFRDTRDPDPRRRDFHGDSDNRDQWQNLHNSGGMSGAFNGGGASTMGMSPNPAPFMMNQNVMGLGRQDMSKLNSPPGRQDMSMLNPPPGRQDMSMLNPPPGRQDMSMLNPPPGRQDMSMLNPPPGRQDISMLNPPPGHPMNRGMAQQGNMNSSAVNPPRVTVGIGPQSPSQFPLNAFGGPPSQRPGLLPTPPRAMAPPGPNFNMPYQAPTNQLNSPRPPPVGLNPFDPRAAAAEFADQFRQKAQQHFASKAPPPRPSAPAPTPPRPPTAPSTAAANPNLASNQIVADLPSDPRRRSQLQRMQLQLQKQQQQQSQQQKQQQQSTSSSAVGGDPRQQRRASSPSNKEKETKEKTDEKKIAGAGKTENTAEASQLKTTKRPVPLERPKDPKDSPKRNIQELRKSLAKRGFHVLGTKTKHFEEVEPHRESEDPAPPPEVSEKDEQEELEDEVKRTDTSPTRNQQAKSTRRSERVTCNKEQQRMSTEDEENDGRRRSARNRKGPEDDKRTKKLSVSEDEDKETTAKNQSKVQKSVEGTIPPVKSVAHFRIPKIKRPEPPPPPPPVPEEPEEIDLASPPSSPLPPSSTPALEIDEDESQESKEENHNAIEHPEISESANVPSTNKEKASLSKTADESIPEKPLVEAKETSKAESSSKSPEKQENVAAGTETLLRLFMAKSVGLSGDILDQIISNPGAMDKIKNLLKDHVSEIVGNDSSSSPAPPDGSEKVEDKKEIEDDDEGGDECSSETIESPAPQDDVPRRGRTMAKKRANKRRSSLEKLHDALREMNFDAVLPLGPRRAVNTRNQEDEEAANSVAESIQSVIDNVVDESNGEGVDLDSSFESENPESGSAPVKRTPKGKKRQASTVNRVPKKRNRKSGNIVAVTEKAAIAAVAAIPDSEVLAQTSHGEHGSQSTSPSLSEAVTCKKRVRKSSTKPEVESSTTKSPAKISRLVRPLPGPDAEVRITRGMIRAATTTSENTEVPIPDENKESRLPSSSSSSSSSEAVKSPVKNEETKADVSVTDTIAASPPKQRMRQYKAKKKVVQPQEVQAGVLAEPELPAEIKVEPIEVDTSPYVFEYCEDCGFDPKEQIMSHDKLLNDPPGANIVVRKVFPDSFGDFLNSILEEDELGKDGENDKADEEVTCEKLLSECGETLDWMMSMVDFKDYQTPNSPDVDLSDLDSTEGVPIKMNETFRRIVLQHSDDCEENGKDEDNDDEEDDDEDMEDEGASSSDADQRQGDKADGKSRDGDAASDEDGNKSPTISGQESADISTKDDPDERESEAQDEADRDSDRKKNLEGHDLYRCANLGCGFSAANGALYKDHALNCIHSQDARNLLCFHCERRLKSIQSLMEHLKIHGTARQLCSLCNFRGWFSSELSKHIKTAHKVYNTKVVTEARQDEDPVYIMYPKGVAGKLTQPTDLIQNHILYTSKVQFRPTDVESVPKSCIFPSLAHCALCDYSTKVRSNIIRHLQLHARSEEDGGHTKVPTQAPVNPVPCLERNELMFDKMTNWAGSSHANKIGGVSKEDTLKLPKFVIDQFRYVCSVSSCKQVTGQDDILCTHMKALHSKEKYYVCPHCQEEEGTKDDPRNTVPIEKIPHHLKLHGPRLSKCGHCDYIHFASTSMEKHVATKHIEKKPIFYLIRDLDSDGNSLVRRSSVDDAAKGPNERWRCTLCKAQLNCWDEAKSHCSTVHKIEHQFECSACHYGSNSIYTITSHVTNKACKPVKVEPKVMIMFLRNENFETTEAKNEESTNVPIWRRDKPRVKHIRGIFLDDENIRPGTSKANAPKLSAATPTAGTSPATTPAKPPAPAPLLVCPKCNLFKAKTAKDLKVHLFNELNYQRYKCIICDVRCVTVESLKAHMNIDHKAIMEDEEKYLLPVSQKTETQVYDMISAILNTQKSNAEDKDGRNIENLLCKHCYLQFSSYHNYRTHILAKHIGSERFRCKHCNAGFWHEAMVKQHHHKSSHANLAVIVIRDNEFENMLTPEFWFREYRIPHNKSLNSAGIGRPEDEFSGTSPSKYSEVMVHGSSGTASPAKKAAVKRRSISTTSDTDKEEEDPLKLTTTPKKCLKHFKELASYYKCEHCLITNFTKRGMRSHWSRSHGMEELPCRYYECKSFDDNLRLNDGYVLKCSTCTFQTSSVEHYQSHHEVEHPGKAFRFKRKKRNELGKNASSEAATIVVCNYCFCEFETVKKCQNHSVQKHAGRPVDYKTMQVSSSAQRDQDLAGAKLIEDSVVVECPVCSKSCGSLKRYVQHYSTAHDELSYADPLTKFSRCYGITEDADALVDMEQQPPKAKMARRNLMDMEVRSSEPAPVKKPPPPPPPAQPTVLYECPKCDFKSDNLDLLCNRHLITHLLAYRCPECNLAFHLHLDAQFHIRHFHGIPRVRPTHNGEAYVEFSSLKDKITKVDVAPRKNVILVNLSDDEDFDDTPTVYPIPNPGDLDELDVEDVRMLLE